MLFSTIFLLENLRPVASSISRAVGARTRRNYNELVARYGQDRDWTEWIAGFRAYLERAADLYGITAEERANPQKLPYWPIYGKVAGKSEPAATPGESLSSSAS